jgi:Cu-processing system ATP-binding protein
MITIEHLCKRFKKLYALNDVSACFTKGQAVTLIGPNGSGKTTLIKSILGMVKPDGGKIYFNNEDISRQVAYRNSIGYMPQIGRYPDNMKIGQVIDMIKDVRNHQKNAVDEELFEAFKMKLMLSKSMRSLSGGTRQKVSAVLAFLFNPYVLILDEPTAGLDPLASEILKEKICSEKKKGKLIIISSHVLSELEELATDVLYLQDGKLQFYQTVAAIKEHTGEERLEKAVTQIMKNGWQKQGASKELFITGKIVNVNYA